MTLLIARRKETLACEHVTRDGLKGWGRSMHPIHPRKLQTHEPNQIAHEATHTKTMRMWDGTREGTAAGLHAAEHSEYPKTDSQLRNSRAHVTHSKGVDMKSMYCRRRSSSNLRPTYTVICNLRAPTSPISTAQSWHGSGNREMSPHEDDVFAVGKLFDLVATAKLTDGAA